MSAEAKKFICIHGHFYQPPRENAWLEVIEVQDSAHPYHDWNERISAECYGPNAASRILDEKSVINNIVNNYSKISFNFGPTLLSWMETNDKETYEAILEADKQSIKKFSGHGSAIAQVYNHIIMPLANRRDKETQVLWGIRDFIHRFKREPEGMWLAETAVDYETLEILAEHNIKFTVFAPRQAKAIRKIGEQNWVDVNDRTIDTRKSYRCNLPSGKSITVFFYDGDISQSVAFNGLLYDGKRFADNLISHFGDQESPQLVHIATDGETYGHHHKHGEMALAYCLDYIDKMEDVALTNYAEYAARFPPTEEAWIIENSSWSCVHGIERWRNDCGCNSGGKPGWNQAWRKPLRESLDWLRDAISELFEREAGKLLKNCWDARNDYINVILRRSDDSIRRFLHEHAQVAVNATQVLRLMEMQRHAMLMYTSCGWFFDEISGIETTQILQYACRSIQLTRQISEVDMEFEFLKRLEEAASNIPALGNGAQVYGKYVTPSKINLQRVGMHYAVSSIFEEEPESLPLFNYEAANEFFLKKEAGEQKLVLGITKVRSLVTHSEKRFAFAVVCIGVHNIIGNISLDMEPDKFASMQYRITHAFDDGRLGDVIGIMQTYFGPDKYTIWQLFKDEKRKILDMIAKKELEELEESLRRTYNRDYPLVNALANNEIPIPNAYRTTFEYILNADLIKTFQSDKINIKTLERIVGELEKWNLKIEDPDRVAQLAGASIFKELKRIRSESENAKRVQRLNRLFPLLAKFKIDPNLHYSQNLYFEMAMDNAKKLQQKSLTDWAEQFQLLGDNLGVKLG
ncbi:MAG: glycoside hydrolase [Azospira oryzae]|jgi:alpha-amylase/alpha-mannosidase (GH57 family)|nr:glycoside hydrolase [Cytophaga sp.]PZR37065.1 MAG: glycoside hydrolase [Azospira oryzae]